MYSATSQLARWFGCGGGSIPLSTGETLWVTRHELAAIFAALSTPDCGALHRAVREHRLDEAAAILSSAALSWKQAQPALGAVPDF